MLPEVGATEYLIIAVVALIVVGPKDLPGLLRRLGQFIAKLRGMASEFRASFDEMARQTELEDLRKEVEAMRRGQFADMADMKQEMRSTVDEIENSLSDVGVQLHPPMSYQYNEGEAALPPVEISEAPKPVKKPRAKAKAVAAKPAAAKAPPRAKPAKAAGITPRSAAPKTKASAKPKPAPKPRAIAAKPRRKPAAKRPEAGS